MSSWDPRKKEAWDVSDNPIDDYFKKPGKDAKKADANAQEGLEQARRAYDGMSAPLPASISNPHVATGAPVTAQSAVSMASMDPQAQAAQRAQMAALAGLAANGGRNAASDANLAHIQQTQGAQAQGLRQAAMQDAARRGMSNGNTGLLAQLQGNQGAMNSASMQGAQVAGQQADTALRAGQGAAGIGAGLQGQAMQIAQAKDLMARFNSGQSLEAAQFNSGQQFDANRINSAQGLAAQQYNSQAPLQQYGAQLATAHGRASGGKTASDYWMNKYGEDMRTDAAQKAGLLQIGTAGIGAMAEGGEVPGPEVVKGDSLLNDIVPYKGPKGPINLSGGEVVVPKTMRNASDQEIASFVKNPPKTSAPQDNELEMRQAALAKLGR